MPLEPTDVFKDLFAQAESAGGIEYVPRWFESTI